MGTVPPKFIKPRSQAELLNRPMNHKLDIIIRPSLDNLLETFMLALGTFLLTLWRNLGAFFAGIYDELLFVFCCKPYEPDYSDFFPLGRSGVVSRPKGKSGNLIERDGQWFIGYQPIETSKRSEPPRSPSAIIPTRSILSQMDEAIDALMQNYHVDASGHVFVLSPQYYSRFYREWVHNSRHYTYTPENGYPLYRSIPVIECAEVVGLALMPVGKQSNSAVLALMKSIEAEIHNRQSSPTPYTASADVYPIPMDALTDIGYMWMREGKIFTTADAVALLAQREDAPMLSDEYSDDGKVIPDTDEPEHFVVPYAVRKETGY